MNKFQKLISTGNEVLKRRAGILATSAEIAQQNLVNNLKSQKSQLEMNLANLTDLAPENKDSLRPGSADWNAEEWAKSVQDVQEKLYSIKIALDIAENTYKEYFTEEAE
jgi:hypothetical protein